MCQTAGLSAFTTDFPENGFSIHKSAESHASFAVVLVTRASSGRKDVLESTAGQPRKRAGSTCHTAATVGAENCRHWQRSALSADPVQDPSQGVGFQWWAFVYQINLRTKPWQEPQGLISQMMLDLLSWQWTKINTPTNYISTIFRKLNGVINFLSECGPGGWNMLPWMATHSTVHRQH